MRKKIKLADAFILSIFLIIVFFIGHNLYLTFIKYKSFRISENSVLTSSYPVRAMLIRDEYTYLTDYKINQVAKIRQAKGSFLVSDVKDYESDLIDKNYIRNMINKLEDIRQNPLKKNKNIGDKEVDDLIDQIHKKNYSSDLITNYYDFVDLSDEESLYIKDQLAIKLYVKESEDNLYSKNSGLVVSKLDNLNSLINYNSKDLLKDDFFLRDSQEIKEYPGLSLVNTMDCFFTFTIKANDFNKNLQKNQNIKFDYKNKTYNSSIRSLNYDNMGNISLLLRLEEGVNDFLEGRYFDIDLVDSNYNVFKIPKKSIIKRAGQDGVFVKNSAGISKFYPVEIVKEENSYVYINSGSNGNISINNKEMETVELNDEIFVHPKLIEEGELVN